MPFKSFRFCIKAPSFDLQNDDRRLSPHTIIAARKERQRLKRNKVGINPSVSRCNTLLRIEIKKERERR